MKLDHQWIASHIPHQGAMCLLDEVLEWNPDEIRCRTGSHRLATNPLRTGDCLLAVCGIEYAAQAVAVHGALCSLNHHLPPTPGMLASVRNVALHIDRLDDIAADLIVSGTRVSGDERALLYEFTVTWDLRVLISGRGTIILTAATS